MIDATPLLRQTDRPAWVKTIQMRDITDWAQLALRSVGRIERLQPNWDGYGSPSPTQDALASSRILIKSLSGLELPTADVAPVTGGGLNFSWQATSKEVEVEVLPDGTFEYLGVVFPSRGGQERVVYEGQLPPSEDYRVKALLDWMLTPMV